MKKYLLAVSLFSCIFSVTLAKRSQAVATEVNSVVTNTNQTQTQSNSITLFGAGSLRGAITEVSSYFSQVYQIPVKTDFAFSGLQRERIENGEKADIFTSADLGNPLKLYQEGLSEPVQTFAGNRLVVIAKPGLSLTKENLLDRLLRSDIKLGIYPPVSDPLGDYTQLVFRKADQLQPGSFEQLNAKSIIVSGTLPPERNSSGGSIVYFIEDTQLVDAEIAYYTSAISALELSPNLQVVELPENLAVKAEYGLTIIKNANPDTAKLVDYILSPSGQTILAKYGFTSPSGTASASIPESQGIWGIVLAVGIVVVLRKNILNLES